MKNVNVMKGSTIISGCMLCDDIGKYEESVDYGYFFLMPGECIKSVSGVFVICPGCEYISTRVSFSLLILASGLFCAESEACSASLAGVVAKFKY